MAVTLLRSRSAVADLLGSLEGDEATGARIIHAALEAGQAHCEQRRSRGCGRRAAGRGRVELDRLQRCDGRDGRPDRRRCHRPGQGHACGAAGRGVDRRSLLTTEALVADKPEEAPAMPMGGDPMGGMGGMGMM